MRETTYTARGAGPLARCRPRETHRPCEFLAQLERGVPWAALVGRVWPHAPEGKKGRVDGHGQVLAVGRLW